MKILHIIPDLSPAMGGPVTAVRGMSIAQAAMGHSVSIVSTGASSENILGLNGVKVSLFPYSLFYWRFSPSLGRALPGLINESDIIHIHTIWEYPTYAAAKACRKLSKPYILRPCGMLDRWSLSQSAWKKKLYLRLIASSVITDAAAIHFTSEEEKINSLVAGNEKRGVVIPLGLPESTYQDLPGPEAFIRRFPDLRGKRILLFLSRLHYKKQPDVVIKAFHKISAMDDRLVLVIAGSGDYQYLSELQTLARELGISDRVIFTGLLNAIAVREAMCAAYIFVLPSLQENFGIAVAEAMAAGCPVIVSEQVNLAAEIRSANAGIVCKSDIEETAAAMQRLINDNKLRTDMGANGRELILNKFTWAKIAIDMISVYQKILSSSDRAQLRS